MDDKSLQETLDKMQQTQQSMLQSMQSLDQRMREQAQQLTKLEARTSQIDRTVAAIESFPVPYGRPKTFFSATETHSVSNSVRVKQGYQG